MTGRSNDKIDRAKYRGLQQMETKQKQRISGSWARIGTNPKGLFFCSLTHLVFSRANCGTVLYCVMLPQFLGEEAVQESLWLKRHTKKPVNMHPA